MTWLNKLLFLFLVLFFFLFQNVYDMSKGFIDLTSTRKILDGYQWLNHVKFIERYHGTRRTLFCLNVNTTFPSLKLKRKNNKTTTKSLT